MSFFWSMINPDITEVLSKYCEWDYIVRNRYLRYAAALLKQHGKVILKGIEYHNFEDLKTDLEADCVEQEKELE